MSSPSGDSPVGSHTTTTVPCAYGEDAAAAAANRPGLLPHELPRKTPEERRLAKNEWARDRYANRTEEERLAKNKRERDRYASTTQGEKNEINAKRREMYQAKWTQGEKDAYNEKRRNTVIHHSTPEERRLAKDKQGRDLPIFRC